MNCSVLLDKKKQSGDWLHFCALDSIKRLTTFSKYALKNSIGMCFSVVGQRSTVKPGR